MIAKRDTGRVLAAAAAYAVHQDDIREVLMAAYIPAWVASNIFGALRVAVDSLGNALAPGNTYKAGSFGILTFTVVRISDTYSCQLLSDSNATPTAILSSQSGTYGADGDSICVPIRKDDYWKIVVGNGTVSNIKWVPLGTGSCVKQ